MDPEPQEPLPIPALRKLTLWRGLNLRCPQCAGRDLFRRYGRLRETCPECGLVLRREQGAQTGAMYLTAAVCQVFATVVTWAAWMLTDWGTWTFIGIAAPIVLLFCYLFLPRSQSIWVAVEYLTDAINKEEWVSPRL